MDDPLEDKPESIESSYWESSYTRLAQFGWLIVVLTFMAMVAFFAGDLRADRSTPASKPADTNR